jgi:hypothetical protein
MLNVENNPFMLSVLILNAIMLSVVAPFKLLTKWHVGKMTGRQNRRPHHYLIQKLRLIEDSSEKVDRTLTIIAINTTVYLV